MEEEYLTIKEISKITYLTRQGIEARVKTLGISGENTINGIKKFSKAQAFSIINNCLSLEEYYPIEISYIRETYCIIPSKLNFMP